MLGSSKAKPIRQKYPDIPNSASSYLSSSLFYPASKAWYTNI